MTSLSSSTGSAGTIEEALTEMIELGCGPSFTLHEMPDGWVAITSPPASDGRLLIESGDGAAPAVLSLLAAARTASQGVKGADR